MVLRFRSGLSLWEVATGKKIALLNDGFGYLDDHVLLGPGGQRFAIASLLVASVAIVAIVHKNLKPEGVSQFHRFIGRTIIHQNAGIATA